MSIFMCVCEVFYASALCLEGGDFVSPVVMMIQITRSPGIDASFNTNWSTENFHPNSLNLKRPKVKNHKSQIKM